ncbi:MAG: aminotransferase class V-fold PLP-dependent enzyme, partial [Planctomycetaceae bacterium]|nr:aminotransferase class V-fold PLP-dependent enzyme [Planctomycetaceae bacterium]
SFSERNGSMTPQEFDATLPAILGGQPIRAAGPPDWPLKEAAIQQALLSTWESGDWGRYHGDNTKRLIDRISRLLRVEHVLPCSSGTAAVELALRGMQVGPGDEVILSAYDFKGNFQDILALGATPVLVDLDPRTWQLDPHELTAAVSSKTKAIIASHLHGGVVAMPEVMEFARAKQIPVLEDACQMPGAVVAGKRAGTWGDAGVWSFGGSKLLTAGRGGAVFTNNGEIAQRIRLWTQRGNDAYPLSELQAAVLLPQLERLEEHELRRWENVERLRIHFSALGGLVPFPILLTESRPGFYKLGLQYESQAFGMSRDRFAVAMRSEGIALDAGFRALHKIHSKRRFRTVGALREADRADECILVLHHPILLTESPVDLQQIVLAAGRIRQHAEQIAK